MCCSSSWPASPPHRHCRGHPDRLRDHRADRDPRRVPGHRGDPGPVRHGVCGDDPAHHQRGRVLRLHRPRPGPHHRRGRRPGGAAGLHASCRSACTARSARTPPARPPRTCTCTPRGGRGRSAPGPSSPSWACCGSILLAASSASCSAPKSWSSSPRPSPGSPIPQAGTSASPPSHRPR